MARRSDASVLVQALVMKLAVEFDWEPLGSITLDPGGKLAFPRLPTEPACIDSD